MILLKILGTIDLLSSLAFLMLIFGLPTPSVFLLFCSLLLLSKGLFIIKGDILSIIDLFSSILLILAIFFALPSILLWLPAFLLLAKGVASFV